MVKVLLNIFIILVLFSSNIFAQAKKTLFINKIEIDKKINVKKDELRVHIVDIILDTNKFEFSLSNTERKESFGNKKFNEELLNLEVSKEGKKFNLKTSTSEKSESLSLSHRTSKRKLLVETRMLLYKTLLTEAEYEKYKKQLRTYSYKKVDSFLKPKKKKRRYVKKKRTKKIKKIVKKKEEKKKQDPKKEIKKVVAVKEAAPIDKKEIKKVTKKSSPKKVEHIKGRKIEEKKFNWGNWPKPYFTAGFVLGQKVTELLSDSQGVPLLEVGAGIHHTNYRWKTYFTISKVSEFDGVEKTATQTNMNFFVTKDLLALKSLPWGLKNIFDDKDPPGHFGLLLGYGTTSFDGKLVTNNQSITGVSMGAYISAIGFTNIELRYFKNLSDVLIEASPDGGFSYIALKLSIGYPM